MDPCLPPSSNMGMRKISLLPLLPMSLYVQTTSNYLTGNVQHGWTGEGQAIY